MATRCLCLPVDTESYNLNFYQRNWVKAKRKWALYTFIYQVHIHMQSPHSVYTNRCIYTPSIPLVYTIHLYEKFKHLVFDLILHEVLLSSETSWKDLVWKVLLKCLASNPVVLVYLQDRSILRNNWVTLQPYRFPIRTPWVLGVNWKLAKRESDVLSTC